MGSERMVDLTCPETLKQIEQAIQYAFRNPDLLVEAFTHSSAADDRLQSNERLEFLGDSVLGIVICQAIFEAFQDHLEGDLTKIKSSLVSRTCCAEITDQLELAGFLRVGKGMSSVKSLPRSIVAGLLEAVIGAIYVDGGFDKARAFVLDAFGGLMEKVEVKGPHGNYKSLLQQYSQEHHGVTPLYSLLDEKGPDHNKCFESEAIFQGLHFPSGWGVTKKEAEQKAAYNALVELGVVEEKKGSESLRA